MRKHRVFIEDVEHGSYHLTGSEAHHLLKVLRVKVGQVLQVFNGKGLEAHAQVLALDKHSLELAIEEPQTSSNEASWHITLAVALLKGDKLADIIRQGTELGVAAFIPVLSDYCDVRDLGLHKLERLRRISLEAAKQCERSVVPPISEAINLTKLNTNTLKLVAHPYSQTTLQESLQPYKHEQRLDILCLTGPEGGFSEAEIAMLEQKGFQAVKLGARILRAETAPIALCAALLIPEAK